MGSDTNNNNNNKPPTILGILWYIPVAFGTKLVCGSGSSLSDMSKRGFLSLVAFLVWVVFSRMCADLYAGAPTRADAHTGKSFMMTNGRRNWLCSETMLDSSFIVCFLRFARREPLLHLSHQSRRHQQRAFEGATCPCQIQQSKIQQGGHDKARVKTHFPRSSQVPG